jgi:hypothetical protein
MLRKTYAEKIKDAEVMSAGLLNNAVKAEKVKHRIKIFTNIFTKVTKMLLLCFQIKCLSYEVFRVLQRD